MSNYYLIIGGSSDLGLAIIKELDQPDIKIIATFNSSYDGLVALQKNFSGTLITLKCDLNDIENTQSFFKEILDVHGSPYKIIHLAAPRVSNIRFKDLTWEDFMTNMIIGPGSLFFALKFFLPIMAKRKSGKIVVVLSSYTIGVPPKALAHYTIAKYAMLGLIKSLASEYSDKNICINAVSPSMIETNFLQNINDKFIALNAYNHPLNRNASVSDVIPAILFLLSEESGYINGVNLPITGGSLF